MCVTAQTIPKFYHKNFLAEVIPPECHWITFILQIVKSNVSKNILKDSIEDKIVGWLLLHIRTFIFALSFQRFKFGFM